MSRTQNMLAAAVGAALTGSAAFATIAPVGGAGSVTIAGPNAGTYFTLVPVTVAATAITDDPTLANFETWDLKVSVSSGDHWAGADMRAQLYGTTKFYIPPANDSNAGRQSIATSAPNRNLTDDTFVTVPLLNAGGVNILGKSSRAPAADPNVPTFPSNGSNFVSGSDPDTGDPTSFEPANNKMLVDVTWGDLNASANTNIGVQTIARLTVTSQATSTGDPTQSGIRGYIVGKMTHTGNPGETIFYTFVIPGNVVPEPTSVALMGLGLGAVALRRRNK
jgi:hypothetical protein